MINNPNWCDGCTPENCPGCSEEFQEQDELMEQARLPGISAEREMALRARVQELERLADLAAARGARSVCGPLPHQTEAAVEADTESLINCKGIP